MLGWDIGDLIDIVAAPLSWVGNKVKDAVSDVLADFFVWIAGLLLDGVLWLFDVIWGFIDDQTTPDVQAGWFVGSGATVGPYEMCLWLGLTFMAIMLLMAVADFVWHRDGSSMIRSVGQNLPTAMFILTGLLTLTTWGIQLGDAISAWMIGQFGDGMHAFPDRLQAAAADGEFGVGILVVVLLALIMMLVLIVLLGQLVIRQGYIYLATAMTACTVGLDLYRPTKGASGKAIRLLVGLIAAKPMIALCFAIAGASMGGAGYAPPADQQQCAEILDSEVCFQVDEPDQAATASASDAGFVDTAATPAIEDQSSADLAPTIGAMLSGTAVMVLAAFSPTMVMRFFTAADASTGAAGASAVAGSARTGAAMAVGAATGGVGGMLSAATGVNFGGGKKNGGSSAPSAAPSKATS